MVILIDSFSSRLVGVGSACARRANQNDSFRSCKPNLDEFYLSGGQLELLSRPFVLMPVLSFRVHTSIAFGLNRVA
jgi:hypothetical protein